MSRDLSEEGDVPRCDLQGFGGDDIVEWQFADPDASAMLGRGQAAELRLRVLSIDGLLQAVTSKQCLSRRLPDEWTLTTQIIAWEETRNNRKAMIRWNFTVDDARVVFKEHYPTT